MEGEPESEEECGARFEVVAVLALLLGKVLSGGNLIGGDPDLLPGSEGLAFVLNGGGPWPWWLYKGCRGCKDN